MGKHEKKNKRHKDKKSKHKHKKRRRSSSESSSSSEDKWVERESVSSKNEKSSYTPPESPVQSKQNVKNEREDWMSVATLFASTSHLDRRQEKQEAKVKAREAEKYDPAKSSRELNPYWKDGGGGLPTNTKRKFAKPEDNDDYYSSRNSSNWRKSSSGRYKKSRDSSDHKHEPEDKTPASEKATTSTSSDTNEQELNEIAAKLIKAEILGQSNLVAKLKEKLELARQQKKSEQSENDVILHRTDSKGLTVPLQKPKSKPQTKNRREATHTSSERSKYYADDGEYSLQELFESAKFNSTAFEEKELMASAMKSGKKDDFDDVFLDDIRKTKMAESTHRKMRDSAVADYQKNLKVLDNCNKCIQNDSMQKNLMISMGETVYLSLPSHEPLTENHCMLVPIRHTSCATQLDENEWEEMNDFRKSLVRMFAAQSQDVIFYETIYAHSRSHMFLNCVPVPKEQGDLAPIYFKKAIDESEGEWSINKKLINLAGKDVRRAVPKGLPYFFVSFGMNEGFAHIIEDKFNFPKYFASEVIGGILDIPHTVWRHPKEQRFDQQQGRVLSFSKMWSEYDCTVKN